MIYLIQFLVFLFGLAVGSFLNCLIYRLEKGEGFLTGRSFCPFCKHILSWKDLIPLFSFLILKGKCRYCQKKFSFQYPLVELTTAILFSSIWQTAVYSLEEFLFLGLIFCFLIVIFVYDLKHYIIPDKVIYPAIVTAIFYRSFKIWNFGNWNLFEIWNLGFGILPSLFFLAIVLISRETWMGFGDFKLAIFIGLILSFPNILVAMFFAFSIGAIIGLILISLGKKTLKSEVPFAPFLVTGTFFTIFFGEQLTNWYLKLFLL